MKAAEISQCAHASQGEPENTKRKGGLTSQWQSANLEHLLKLGSGIEYSSNLLREIPDRIDGARRDSMADPPPSEELAYEASSYVSAYAVDSGYEVSAKLGLAREAISRCVRYLSRIPGLLWIRLDRVSSVSSTYVSARNGKEALKSSSGGCKASETNHESRVRKCKNERIHRVASCIFVIHISTWQNRVSSRFRFLRHFNRI